MKNKILITTTIVFFLIVNLNHFWEGEMGVLAFPIFLFLAILYFVLVVLCFIQVGKGFGEKFSNRNRNWTIGVMVICLGLIFLKPTGLINFDQLEGENLFVAQREGGGNCMTTLKLKPNNKFKERSVCFGVSEVNGRYEIRNDTIFFLDVKASRGEDKYFEFAVLKKSKYRDELAMVRYQSQRDTVGSELWIIKNEIIK